MNATVHIAMFGWPLAVFLLFMWLKPSRAVIVAYVTAWLFLPISGYELPLFPDYTKETATSLTALAGAAIFAPGPLTALRFRWFDVPLALWILSPLISSLNMGLGVYDGASGAMSNVIIWAVPYLLGRAYFTTNEDRREVALAIFVGGLAYVPLCLLEIRLSPQLHTWIYGFHQHGFEQAMRYGGWRPTVFLHHGLMVGSWMGAATLCGFWLWYTGSLRRLFGFDVLALTAAVAVTAILCKSIGALTLTLTGICALIVTSLMRTPIAVVALLFVPPIYVAARVSGAWDATDAVAVATPIFGADRANSLAFRMEAEDILLERAMQRPWIGHARSGASYVVDEYGKPVTTDGFWIIVLGTSGFFGLAASFAAMLTPPLRLLLSCPGRAWCDRNFAATSALAVLVILYAIDWLPNAMLNAVFMLSCGAISAASYAGATADERRGRRVRSLSRGLWPRLDDASASMPQGVSGPAT